ncbi:hypothetical protein ACFV2N_41645 [Streptomyces sp. NPDC059680]|uniref:hypothetical protein n=1 Tax=Streptomyces sp. NPDC059680 TaxID=3346904 RepID=UPI00368CCFE5
MTSEELVEPEQWLIEFLRRETQAHAQLSRLSDSRYSCTAELLLDHGRLFTPASAVVGAGTHPSGCAARSASTAAPLSAGLLYVEGWAWGTRRPALRAWSATADGRAQDFTCPRQARAYLGLPLTTETMVTLVVEQSVPLLPGDGMLTPTILQWLRNGVPEGALADAGRPVPGGAEGLRD